MRLRFVGAITRKWRRGPDSKASTGAASAAVGNRFAISRDEHRHGGLQAQFFSPIWGGNWRRPLAAHRFDPNSGANPSCSERQSPHRVARAATYGTSPTERHLASGGSVGSLRPPQRPCPRSQQRKLLLLERLRSFGGESGDSSAVCNEQPVAWSSQYLSELHVWAEEGFFLHRATMTVPEWQMLVAPLALLLGGTHVSAAGIRGSRGGALGLLLDEAASLLWTGLARFISNMVVIAPPPSHHQSAAASVSSRARSATPTRSPSLLARPPPLRDGVFKRLVFGHGSSPSMSSDELRMVEEDVSDRRLLQLLSSLVVDVVLRACEPAAGVKMIISKELGVLQQAAHSGLASAADGHSGYKGRHDDVASLSTSAVGILCSSLEKLTATSPYDTVQVMIAIASRLAPPTVPGERDDLDKNDRDLAVRDVSSARRHGQTASRLDEALIAAQLCSVEELSAWIRGRLVTAMDHASRSPPSTRREASPSSPPAATGPSLEGMFLSFLFELGYPDAAVTFFQTFVTPSIVPRRQPSCESKRLHLLVKPSLTTCAVDNGSAMRMITIAYHALRANEEPQPPTPRDPSRAIFCHPSDAFVADAVCTWLEHRAGMCVAQVASLVTPMSKRRQSLVDAVSTALSLLPSLPAESRGRLYPVFLSVCEAATPWPVAGTPGLFAGNGHSMSTFLSPLSATFRQAGRAGVRTTQEPPPALERSELAGALLGLRIVRLAGELGDRLSLVAWSKWIRCTVHTFRWPEIALSWFRVVLRLHGEAEGSGDVFRHHLASRAPGGSDRGHQALRPLELDALAARDIVRDVTAVVARDGDVADAVEVVILVESWLRTAAATPSPQIIGQRPQQVASTTTSVGGYVAARAAWALMVATVLRPDGSGRRRRCQGVDSTFVASMFAVIVEIARFGSKCDGASVVLPKLRCAFLEEEDWHLWDVSASLRAMASHVERLSGCCDLSAGQAVVQTVRLTDVGRHCADVAIARFVESMERTIDFPCAQSPSYLLLLLQRLLDIAEATVYHAQDATVIAGEQHHVAARRGVAAIARRLALRLLRHEITRPSPVAMGGVGSSPVVARHWTAASLRIIMLATFGHTICERYAHCFVPTPEADVVEGGGWSTDGRASAVAIVAPKLLALLDWKPHWSPMLHHGAGAPSSAAGSSSSSASRSPPPAAATAIIVMPAALFRGGATPSTAAPRTEPHEVGKYLVDKIALDCMLLADALVAHLDAAANGTETSGVVHGAACAPAVVVFVLTWQAAACLSADELDRIIGGAALRHALATSNLVAPRGAPEFCVLMFPPSTRHQGGLSEEDVTHEGLSAALAFTTSHTPPSESSARFVMTNGTAAEVANGADHSSQLEPSSVDSGIPESVGNGFLRPIHLRTVLAWSAADRLTKRLPPPLRENNDIVPSIMTGDIRSESFRLAAQRMQKRLPIPAVADAAQYLRRPGR